MSVSDRKRHPTRFPPNERYPVGGCHPRKITAATEFQKPMLRSGQEPSNAKIQWQLPRTRTWPGPIKGRIATDATEDIPRPVKSNAIACARIGSLSFFLSLSLSLVLFLPFLSSSFTLCTVQQRYPHACAHARCVRVSRLVIKKLTTSPPRRRHDGSPPTNSYWSAALLCLCVADGFGKRATDPWTEQFERDIRSHKLAPLKLVTIYFELRGYYAASCFRPRSLAVRDFPMDWNLTWR